MSTTHEEVRLGTAETDPAGPARVLALAVRSADQLLAEARADAERMTTAARAEADQILASARNDAEQVRAAVEVSRAGIREDAARLRQARWERHQRMPEHLPRWLEEAEASEAG